MATNATVSPVWYAFEKHPKWGEKVNKKKVQEYLQVYCICCAKPKVPFTTTFDEWKNLSKGSPSYDKSDTNLKQVLALRSVKSGESTSNQKSHLSLHHKELFRELFPIDQAESTVGGQTKIAGFVDGGSSKVRFFLTN
jgi:hypothetical protein